MPPRCLFLNRCRSVVRNGFQMDVGDVRTGKENIRNIKVGKFSRRDLPRMTFFLSGLPV